jgi:pimeloyl-ACP methyl ester carboxylesterase
MSFARFSARITDWGMCTMMDVIQRRHRMTFQAPRDFRFYLEEHAGQTRDSYFHAPPPQPGDYNLLMQRHTRLRWQSPITTPWPDNNHAHVDYYLGPGGTGAPTVLMLHALMSASDLGYKRWAARFNERGWNACFLHLPYHYSRKPAGRLNGELAITADVIRTAEGLRQGVSEARQLLNLLRGHGCRDFALWGTSYGGWIGALLLSVEHGIRWASLMAPIVDVHHAIWHSPAGAATRRELRRVGIDEATVERHFHLVSPLHAKPLDEATRVLLFAGEWDRVVEARDVEEFHRAWPASEYALVPQGHFGYRMMREAWKAVGTRGLLNVC